jgi:hypothetical protein
MCSDRTSADTVTTTASTALELDDIQFGMLHQRPASYVGTYLLLRIDNREAGRKLVQRLLPVIESARSSSDPAQNAWVSVAFTYQGLKALGVPQDSLDSFAPEFRQGMGARAAELGDVGLSGPENWEKPLGSPEVHVTLSVLSPDAAARYVESPARSRSGLAKPMARNPWRCRARISASKPVASAHAPWTRTIVGVSAAIVNSLLCGWFARCRDCTPVSVPSQR